MLDTLARFPCRAAGPADGELVLLLHGFPEVETSWDGVLEGLGDAGWRAVAPRQRGYAAEVRPRAVREYGVRRLVDDVLAMADAAGAERFHVVGHDWGGVVAWALAAWHPERLCSMTAVSTPHPKAMGKAMLSSSQPLRSAYILFFRTPWLPERLLTARNGAGLRAFLRLGGLDRAHADEYADELSDPAALGAALNYYRAISPRDSVEIGDVTVPTMYVWSTRDAALGRRAAEATASHVTGPYRFEVLEGASHWIPEERPDDLRRLLLEHLAAHRCE